MNDQQIEKEIQNKENAEEVVNRLRGQLQNCVNHLERARRNDRKRIYDDCIESANRALYETLTT